jgi:NADH:ubiquinone oxidoreductase subunit K
MNKSKVVFGVFFIFLGAYLLINNMFEINLGQGIPYIIAALVLGGFYYAMKKPWIGILSLWMLYVGIIDLAPRLPVVGPYLDGSIAFLIPGIFFLVYYFTKKKAGHLIFGAILFWIGIAKVFANVPNLEPISYEILLICLGLAFITIYFVKLRQWTLVPAAVLIILGAWDITNYYYELKVGNISITSLILAVVLIGFGIGLLVDKNKVHVEYRSMHSHHKNDDDSVIDVEAKDKE